MNRAQRLLGRAPTGDELRAAIDWADRGGSWDNRDGSMNPSPEYIEMVDADISHLAHRIEAITAEMDGKMGNDLLSLATELGLAVHARQQHLKYRERLERTT